MDFYQNEMIVEEQKQKTIYHEPQFPEIIHSFPEIVPAEYRSGQHRARGRGQGRLWQQRNAASVHGHVEAICAYGQVPQFGQATNHIYAYFTTSTYVNRPTAFLQNHSFPEIIHSFPEIVPAEYRSGQVREEEGKEDCGNNEMQHPYTGMSRQFVLMDRFPQFGQATNHIYAYFTTSTYVNRPTAFLQVLKSLRNPGKTTNHSFPEIIHSFPEIVPAEYRSGQVREEEGKEDCGNNEMQHPYTGMSRQFVLMDRFHNSAKPHKSHLCLFHDINLCQQANCISTSTQESEKSRKNNCRLRISEHSDAPLVADSLQIPQFGKVNRETAIDLGWVEIATGVFIAKIALNASVKTCNTRTKVALKLLNRFYPDALLRGKGLKRP
ncbi:hypothetical protein OS493_024287 [Desmophyllum pertusum]|uniref:Uncharacterized protein n=1 Tax=Desmophyllum pertusum TaxID=174260 RepID=A0A9W9YY42_9CNID|nr:hypothetical protein OS493_024287 [Desmophyllum pertusum]